MGVVLQAKGYPIIGVADRDPERMSLLSARLGIPGLTSVEVAQQAEIVLVTTNDGAIGEVIRELADAASFKPGQTVMHMSGALTSEVLLPAAKQGAVVLSVHPLQSFAAVEQAINILPGSFFSIEGDSAGFVLATKMVEELDGEYFFIDKKDKPLYHAGACVVSNYLVTVIDFGSQLLEAAGIPKEKALPALLPLIEGTLKNIRKIGIPQALTGPIARGDKETIQKHLLVMEEVAPDLVPLYRYLGQQTITVAERKGSIGKTKVLELQEALKQQET
jgi:predicted short-subunit dehydrogenase-like oxidoreductase (DUF2520 family)